jgi:hypothetical protein
MQKAAVFSLTYEAFHLRTGAHADAVAAFGAVQGFAVNGVWRSGNEAGVNNAIAGLMRTGGILEITNRWDTRGREPQRGFECAHATCGFVEGEPCTTLPHDLNCDDCGFVQAVPCPNAKDTVDPAIIVRYEIVMPRPRMDRMFVNYLLLAEHDDARNNGSWTLASTSGAEGVAITATNLVYAEATGSAQPPLSAFEEFKPAVGVEVKPLNAQGRVVRTNYFFMIEASSNSPWTPASNVVRFAASSLTRAVNIRPNYRTELLRVRPGVTTTTDLADKDEYVHWAREAGSIPGKDAVTATAIATRSLDLSDGILASTEATVSVFRRATATQPRSAVSTVTLAPRAAAPSNPEDRLPLIGTLTRNDTAFRLSPRYEVLMTAPGDRGHPRYGSQHPGFSDPSVGTVPNIRLKSTARVTPTGYSGLAAGVPLTLTLTWAANSDGVMQITAAVLAP